jgi:hypothetical protein
MLAEHPLQNSLVGSSAGGKDKASSEPRWKGDSAALGKVLGDVTGAHPGNSLRPAGVVAGAREHKRAGQIIFQGLQEYAENIKH